MAWAIQYGAIPEGFEIDHFSCSTPACSNWRHLRAVPPVLNTRRSNSPSGLRARLTHCQAAGHEFTAENTRIHYDPKGRPHRSCLACYRLHHPTLPRTRQSREERLAYFQEYNRTRRKRPQWTPDISAAANKTWNTETENRISGGTSTSRAAVLQTPDLPTGGGF